MTTQAQNWLDRDFANSTSRLVDLILPNAAPEDRDSVLGALAAFASNIKHQTVDHITRDWKEAQ